MSQIISVSNKPRYSTEEIKKIFPPVDRQIRRQRKNFVPNKTGEIIQIASVYSALHSINPDIGYMDWIKIGMALHHECNGGQEGLDLWNEWSAQGKNYREGECEYRWSTFSG